LSTVKGCGDEEEDDDENEIGVFLGESAEVVERAMLASSQPQGGCFETCECKHGYFALSFNFIPRG
jgi:hypothetical protein